MTAALIIVSIVALVAVGGVVLLSRGVPALAAKVLANGEELLKERAAKKEAEKQRDAAIAMSSHDRARADESEEQLEATQRELNTATLELAAVEQERVLGMSNEQAFEAVRARLRMPLSSRGGTELERP
jgi:hypothetical protein